MKTEDSTKSEAQSTEASGQTGIGNTVSRDSVKNDTPAKSHIHGAPNQDKIDSIKNEKLKDKKPK